MKISSTLKILVVILLFFSVVSLGFVFLQLNKISSDGRIVNYAGIVRGATQRLIKLEMAGQQSDALISKIDKIINGLKNGDEELRLVKASDDKFLSKMKEVESAWSKLKNNIIQSRQNPVKSALINESEDYFKLTDSLVTSAEEFSKGKVVALKTTMIIIFVLNTAVLSFVWIMSRRKIARPLSYIAQKIEEIAGGNLRIDLECSSKDEIGVIAVNVDKMLHDFTFIINNMLLSINKIVEAMDVFTHNARRTAAGSKEQSVQASLIATAAEEMSQTITDIAKNTVVASDTSTKAMKTAETGKQVADGAVETVNRVYTSTVKLSSMVEKLNKSVSEIGDIVTVIKDIADQTNLLALNAAIEAARAGEQGRGFAVVADEVRKLAERTIKATSEISEKIGAVQAESEQTTKSMEEASIEVTKANDFIRQVGDSLNYIVDSVHKVRDQITQIATAVDEQSAASEEVANNVEKTSVIAKKLNNMAVNTSNKVSELMSMIEELRSYASTFKTKGSELMMLDIARTDHRLFMGRIAATIDGFIRLDASQLPDHHNCRFGKWYDGEGKNLCGTLPSYKAIDAPHEKIHSMAKEAVLACNSGDNEKAQRIYREMENVSDQIGSLLDSIKRECK